MSEGIHLECHKCHRSVEAYDFYLCDDCGLGFCDKCVTIIEAGEDFSEDACFCQRCLFDEEGKNE
jgi:hypothetical protein